MHPYDLETAAHVVQQALAPVFLLSGIAALLSVFSTRLARTADQAYALSNDERFGIWGGLSERERRKLRKRAG